LVGGLGRRVLWSLIGGELWLGSLCITRGDQEENSIILGGNIL